MLEGSGRVEGGKGTAVGACGERDKGEIVEG